MPTKIKLPLSKIKEFIELSSKVREKVDLIHLPTAEYIKFEVFFGECFLTKNSNASFIEFKFDVTSYDIDDISFLLHEDKLQDFCSTLKSHYLFISIDDDGENKEIKISDSEKMKDSKKLSYNSNSIKIEFFPSTEYRTKIAGKKKTTLNSDVISSIDFARNIISNDPIRPAFTCVYLGDFNPESRELDYGNYVFSSSGIYAAYIKEFDNYIFSPIAIQKKEIDVIISSGIKSIEYISLEEHNIYFFPNGNVVFGFRKIANTNGFPFCQFRDGIKKEKYISIRVDDILLFCTRAKASSAASSSASSSINSSCKVSKANSTATFKYLNADSGAEDIKECELDLVVGDMSDFNINQNEVYRILRQIPYNILHISVEENFIGLTTPEDENFFGLFAHVRI